MLQQIREKHPHVINIAVFVILHTVGIIGLSSQWKALFVQLTPVNLMICAVLIWNKHQNWKSQQMLILLLCFLAGYVVEVLGVHSGVIFGEYSYGEGFGPKLFSVPPLIGLNWALLIYASATLVNRFLQNYWLRVVLSAILMTALDFLIEPVAIQVGFWTWEGGNIPLQNFAAWFVISLLLQSLWQRVYHEGANRSAIGFFWVQVAFFGLLGLL